MSGLSSLYNRAMTGLGSLRGGNNAIGRGLASLDRLANEQLRYLTGPQGYAALTGATALAREVTPAADFRDVADYSGRLVKSDTLGDVLGNTAGLGAAGAMVFLPGSMGMVDDAVDGARKGIRAYHSADVDFDTFDPKMFGTKTDDGELGLGAYLTTDPRKPSWAKHLLEFDVNVEKPLRLKMSKWSDDKNGLVRGALGLDSATTASDVSDALRARGHDGVILDYSPLGYEHQEIMALNPEAARRVKALTPSQKQADDVLRLIKEDPSKVTDDMLGALDAEGNRYLFDNYDMPMDEASRTARADEFFPSSAAHGSGADIKAVDNDRLIGGQFWSTDDLPAIAREEVGAAGHGVTIPLRLKTDNPAGWREYDKFGVDELIGRGYDSLRLPEKDGTNTFVTFDPNQVRSRFARFDPRLKHLSNLLAGGAGLAVLPRSVWEDDDANR